MQQKLLQQIINVMDTSIYVTGPVKIDQVGLYIIITIINYIIIYKYLIYKKKAIFQNKNKQMS